MKKMNSKSLSLALAATTALTALVACGPTGGELLGGQALLSPNGQLNTFANGQRRGGKKWVLAIHMAADNNLYTAGLDDINEMEAGLKSEDVEIIVLFDGSPRGDSKLMRIKSDKSYDKNIISETINDNGAVVPASKEIDSGDPEVFNRFVDYVTKNHPSEKVMFSIWNHGSGIYRNGAPNPAGGSFMESIGNIGQFRARGMSSKAFASDDNGGEMALRDLNPAMAIANKNLGRPVDVFGFDTCLMGHIETAYQLKGQANFLVASEELEPGDGWDYNGYVSALSKNPNMSPAELSASIVETYGRSYMPGGSQSGRDVTLSALDINRVAGNVAPALGALGEALSADLANQKAAVQAVRAKTQVFYNRDAADLGHFLTMFSKSGARNPGTAAAANALTAFQGSVVKEAHVGSAVGNAQGALAYFPQATMSYNSRYDDANQIRFAETKLWGAFLKKFTGK